MSCCEWEAVPGGRRCVRCGMLDVEFPDVPRTREKPSCATCTFFDRRGIVNPPVSYPYRKVCRVEDPTHGWPTVRDDDWCGKWSKR